MNDPRLEWIRELERRQDNIDPIRRIPNDALFQGTLIKGNLRLNRVQRVGALLLGTCNLVVVVVIVAAAIDRGADSPGIGALLFCPLSLWFAWKMIRNAIVNDRARPRSTRR